MRNFLPSSASNRNILTSGNISSRLRFVLSRHRNFVLRLVIISAISAAHLSLAKQPGIAIQFDPNPAKPKMDAIWLGYLLGRAAYRSEHKLPLPASGMIVPSFEEEVYARNGAAQVYQELKEKEKGLHDSYWETLLQIKTKGFMNAYVWTYLRRANWPKSQEPKNLAAFQTWSRSFLKNHKAQTYGSLAVQ